MLPEVEGKKVYVEDFLVGTIVQLTYDDVGNQIVVIKTVFEELPTVEVEAISLRKTTKEGEEVYQLKTVPVKLKELIEKKKLEEEMMKAEEEIAKEEIPIIEEKPTPPPETPAPPPSPPKPKKKSIWQRIIEFFKKLFKRKKKGEGEAKPKALEEKIAQAAQAEGKEKNPEEELREQVKEKLSKQKET